MIESLELSVAQEKHHETESTMNRSDRFENALNRVNAIGKEFEQDAEKDTADLNALAKSLGLSSEEVESVMSDYGEGRNRLLRQETNLMNLPRAYARGFIPTKLRSPSSRLERLHPTSLRSEI